MEELITTAEAAKILGVNDSRVRQMIRAGELPARRMEARGQFYYLLSRADVEELARRPRRPGPAPRAEEDRAAG